MRCIASATGRWGRGSAAKVERWRGLVALSALAVATSCNGAAPSPDGGPDDLCVVDGDCRAGLRCCLVGDGPVRACQAECACRSDDDCGGGRCCPDGACVRGDQSCSACTEDRHCFDHCCPDGTCSTFLSGCLDPCTSNADCVGTDVCCASEFSPELLCRQPINCLCSSDADCPPEQPLCCDGTGCQTACGPCETDADCEREDLACCVDPGGGGALCLARPCEAPPPPPTPVALGAHDTVDDTEAVAHAIAMDLFGVGTQAWALVAGQGTAVHDLSDGSIEFGFPSATDPRYSVRAVRWEDGTDTLFSVGPDGYAVRPYIASMSAFGFQFLGLIGHNATDADPLPVMGDPTRTRSVLVVDNLMGEVADVARDAFGSYVTTTAVTAAELLGAGVSGRVVSVHPTTDGEGVVGVTETDLFFYDGATVTPLGTLGTGLRLIDCAAGRCAVPDFLAGEVVIFLHDGSTVPSLAEVSRAPIPGAVTVDVLEDGRVLVPSSSTGTAHRLTLDPITLAIMTDEVCALGASGPAPFHANGIPGTDIGLFDLGPDGRYMAVDFTSCTRP